MLPNPSLLVHDPARLKRAELTSSVGAGVLGGGLALLLAEFLRPYAIPLLVLGGLLHAWGMLDRHRLDRLTGTDLPRWARALYWICWIGLFALALYIIVGRLRS